MQSAESVPDALIHSGNQWKAKLNLLPNKLWNLTLVTKFLFLLITKLLIIIENFI